MRPTSAFTLVEVQVAILVLIIGLAAGLSLVLTGNAWGRELRRDVIALGSARMVAENPRLLDASADLHTSDPLEGYYNDFYFRREVEAMTVPAWDDASGEYRQVPLSTPGTDPRGAVHGGHWYDVRILAYEGVIDGDIDTGTDVLALDMKVQMP
ncbi:MAG: type II secretion system protein [Planctomycetota bacterium]